MKGTLLSFFLAVVLCFGVAVAGHYVYKAVMNDVRQEVTDIIDNR